MLLCSASHCLFRNSAYDVAALVVPAVNTVISTSYSISCLPADVRTREINVVHTAHVYIEVTTVRLLRE